ncbi:hypothetical protein ACWD1Y_42280 [Streptomyces sp. NPDC002814]
MQSAEWQLRKTIRQISSFGLLGRPNTVDLQIVAESALLLGRALRLRGSKTEAYIWIQRAAEMFGYILRTGETARPSADKLIESLNAITLIELDTCASGANNHARIIRSLDAQRGLYESDLDFRSRSDAYLEVTQRTIEAIRLTQPSESSTDFMRGTLFRELSSEMGDHTRALRLAFMARVAADEGDLEEASQALTQIEPLSVIAESNFVRIMYLEAAAIFFDRTDQDQAHRFRQEARHLRSLEKVNEHGG